MEEDDIPETEEVVEEEKITGEDQASAVEELLTEKTPVVTSSTIETKNPTEAEFEGKDDYTDIKVKDRKNYGI